MAVGELEILFTPEQVAEACQVHTVTVIRAIHRGELKAHDISRPDAKRRVWRISHEQLAAWLEVRANVTATTPPRRRLAVPAQIEPPEPVDVGDGPTGRRRRRSRPATGRLKP